MSHYIQPPELEREASHVASLPAGRSAELEVYLAALTQALHLHTYRVPESSNWEEIEGGRVPGAHHAVISFHQQTSAHEAQVRSHVHIHFEAFRATVDVSGVDSDCHNLLSPYHGLCS